MLKIVVLCTLVVTVAAFHLDFDEARFKRSHEWDPMQFESLDGGHSAELFARASNRKRRSANTVQSPPSPDRQPSSPRNSARPGQSSPDRQPERARPAGQSSQAEQPSSPRQSSPDRQSERPRPAGQSSQAEHPSSPDRQSARARPAGQSPQSSDSGENAKKPENKKGFKPK